MPMNPGGATPTTVNGCPLRVSDLPTMAGSAPRCRVQKPWLSEK
jgi:hypothetical protein